VTSDTSRSFGWTAEEPPSSGDLDAYPRTNAPDRPTPSSGKSPYTPDREEPHFGHLLETFVVGEVLAQATWTEGVTSAGRWRTWDNTEVDLVIEADDGRVVAFEITAASGERR